jgi:hypothetical protein
VHVGGTAACRSGLWHLSVPAACRSYLPPLHPIAVSHDRPLQASDAAAPHSRLPQPSRMAACRRRPQSSCSGPPASAARGSCSRPSAIPRNRLQRASSSAPDVPLSLTTHRHCRSSRLCPSAVWHACPSQLSPTAVCRGRSPTPSPGGLAYAPFARPSVAALAQPSVTAARRGYLAQLSVTADSPPLSPSAPRRGRWSRISFARPFVTPARPCISDASLHGCPSQLPITAVYRYSPSVCHGSRPPAAHDGRLRWPSVAAP